jgi:hypothetical protein
MSSTSRPTTTEALITRLGTHHGDATSNREEQCALRSLAMEMVSLFPDVFIPPCVAEAAALARVLSGNDYLDLFRAFSDAVMACGILRADLLDGFARASCALCT